MNKAISCKIHPAFYVQWVSFQNEKVVFGCIKCYRSASCDLIFIPDLIQNPEDVINLLPISKDYIQYYNKLKALSQQELTDKYDNFEKQLNLLYSLLKNMIEEGRKNHEQFIQQSIQAQQQLLKGFKIQEIFSVIKEFDQKKDEDIKIQDEIVEKLSQVLKEIKDDVQKSQNSQIKQTIQNTNLLINKYNFHCMEQIQIISQNISAFSFQLQDYLEKLFSQKTFSPQRNEDQKCRYCGYQPIKKDLPYQNLNYPFYFSRVLPQYYFNYLLNFIGIEPSNQKTLFFVCNRFNPQEKQEQITQRFWEPLKDQKVPYDGKRKLFIFQSQNEGNPIFGYFQSYYQCNQMFGQSQSQNMNFIFSFTQNEIYPQKQILQNTNQQNFGSLNNLKQSNPVSNSLIVGNFDMEIQANMIDGISYLGLSYQWDNKKDHFASSDYLFGGAKPNLQYCEVFYF